MGVAVGGKKGIICYHIAKPVYENGFLMYIEIYKYNKKVAKIPVSVEYKNRALFARLLCRVGVNQ